MIVDPIVIFEPVLLATDTLSVFAVGYLRIDSIPLVLGINPVIASGLELKSTDILSVVKSPVQAAVKLVKAAVFMVPLIAIVPLQIVWVATEGDILNLL